MLFIKSNKPAKRATRARYIELNGPSERVELLLLIFMAPLWGLVFPLIGISQLNSYCGVTLLGASFFCFLHFLHLNNSRFSFEENGVRLPGVDHRLLPYSSLQRIYMEKLSPLLMAVEFVPHKSPFKFWQKEEESIQQLFEIQHLTEESARQMWSLFASHLRSCSISLDIRDRLVNWRTQGSKPELEKATMPLKSLSQSADKDLDHLELAHQTQNPTMMVPYLMYERSKQLASPRSTEIARDLSMVVELKPFDPIKLIGQYMVSYSDTFRKTWLSCWMVVAGVAYPVSIAAMLANPLTERGIIDTTQTQGAAQAQTSLMDWLGTNGGHLTDISKESLMQLFGNHLGAIGLFILLYFAVYKLIRHINEPDSMYIDYMGITTQKRTPAGVQPKEHRSWKSISAINLVRPHEKSNSSRWSIAFVCAADTEKIKETIEVPFKAFSSDRIRTQFIECLDTWGRNINTSPDLLEALAPRGQASYTELWLSALSEAPKIDSLTPHSVGLRLQDRAYIIESQLASGGQGVAYLAKKRKNAHAVNSHISVSEKAVEVPVGGNSEEATAQSNSLAAAGAKAGSPGKPDSNGKLETGAAGKETSDSNGDAPPIKLVVGGEEGSGADTKNIQNSSQGEVAKDQVAHPPEPQDVTAPEEEGEYEQVVLKETVLPIYVDDRARAKALSRFERDAKLLASLQHPLIVKLEDFFVENNRAYLALEYIHGKTLKEKVESEGPLTEAEVKRLALMMTDILEYLHNRTPQVVHRDFTPDNLMLTHNGKIKLIDFDVAMEQSSFSQTNATIVGKQAYIPLEQFRGKPGSQSDIYALGATLFYLLTGQEPPALQSSRPRSVKVEISEEMDNIIASATAVELADRVQNAAALRRLLIGEEGQAENGNGGAGQADRHDGEKAGNGKVNIVVATGQNSGEEEAGETKAEEVKLVVAAEANESSGHADTEAS